MSQSLGQAVDNALSSHPGQSVDLTQGDTRARVDVEQSGPVGVRVRSVSVTAPRADVEQLANALPHALRALPEPLVPVEVAPSLRGAILRTDPAAMEDDAFFEVEVRDDTIRVDRYKRQSSGRESIAFDLTRNQLGRVIDGMLGE